MVELVDAGKRRERDSFEYEPGTTPMNDLGLVESIDRLSESIVIAADGWLDAGLGQALSVVDADILRTSIGVMRQAAARNGPSLVKRMLQCMQHEAGMSLPAHPPANDPR